jgi:hypothetical protein
VHCGLSNAIKSGKKLEWVFEACELASELRHDESDLDLGLGLENRGLGLET